MGCGCSVPCLAGLRRALRLTKCPITAWRVICWSRGPARSLQCAHTLGTFPALSDRIPGGNSQDLRLSTRGSLCSRTASEVKAGAVPEAHVDAVTPGTTSAVVKPAKGGNRQGGMPARRAGQSRGPAELWPGAGQAQDDSGWNRWKLSLVLGRRAHAKWRKGISMGIKPALSLCPRRRPECAQHHPWGREERRGDQTTWCPDL